MSRKRPPEAGGFQGGLNRAALATSEQLGRDMVVVRRALPPSYTVRESKQPNAIHCTSDVGIGDDAPAGWDAVISALRQHFGARMTEVSESVCSRHTDFTIHLAFRHKDY